MKLIFFALGASLAATLLAAPAASPNYIIILADDLGYGDLGVQGSTTIATPRLDRMAREGIGLRTRTRLRPSAARLGRHC